MTLKVSRRAAIDPFIVMEVMRAANERAAEGGDVPDLKVDFPDVLRRGGLSNDEQGRVDRALTLLHALPAETPVEIKRQIVGASLQAFGIPVEQIIESAALHLYAYDRHIKEGQAQTQALLEQSNRRLAELEQEVARVKLVMQEQLTQQRGLTAACNKQKLRVQEVLTFFGEEALNKVAQTSPKLRDKMKPVIAKHAASVGQPVVDEIQAEIAKSSAAPATKAGTSSSAMCRDSRDFTSAAPRNTSASLPAIDASLLNFDSTAAPMSAPDRTQAHYDFRASADQHGGALRKQPARSDRTALPPASGRLDTALTKEPWRSLEVDGAPFRIGDTGPNPVTRPVGRRSCSRGPPGPRRPERMHPRRRRSRRNGTY
mgnify:CR=1 FL=1